MGVKEKIMRRPLVTLLVISLFSLPLLAQDRVEKARCISLEHVRGAWRMQISCERGDGSISLADSGTQNLYRGDGAFAKWSQDDLRATYQLLMPKESTPGF